MTSATAQPCTSLLPTHAWVRPNNLLEHGANPVLRNRKGPVPAEVVPEELSHGHIPGQGRGALVAKELCTLLEEAVPFSCALPRVTLPNYDNVPGNAMLSTLGLHLGDCVLLDGQKTRSCGSAGPQSSPMASGWACSLMNLRARMMAVLGVSGTSSALPSRVSLPLCPISPMQWAHLPHPSPPHLGLPGWTSPESLAKTSGNTKVRRGPCQPRVWMACSSVREPRLRLETKS